MDQGRVVKQMQKGFILTQELPEPTTTGRFIVKKSQSEKRVKRLQVLQVGEGCQVEVGDVVVVQLSSGTPYKEYTIIHTEHVLLTE